MILVFFNKTLIQSSILGRAFERTLILIIKKNLKET